MPEIAAAEAQHIPHVWSQRAACHDAVDEHIMGHFDIIWDGRLIWLLAGERP